MAAENKVETTAAGARTANHTPWRIQIVGSSHRVLDALNDEVTMFDPGQLEFWQGIVHAVNSNRSAFTALAKIAHFSPASTVQPVAIARQALVDLLGAWDRDTCDKAIEGSAALAKTGGAS